MPRLPRNIKLLGWASLVNDTASEMIYPLMPQFLLTVLGGNRFQLGIIEGVADSVSSLLKLWSGAWSDRAGKRKTFVVTGYLLAALARPLNGLATMPWHMLANRFLDRVGKGIRTAPRDALIADSSTPAIRGRAFGFHRAMDHLGAAIGPVLAFAFLALWPGEFRWLFAVTLVPGLAVVLMLVVGLREAPAASTERREPVRLKLAPLGGRFRMYLVALVIFTLGNSSDAFLLVRAGELGVSASMLPLLWCAFHIVKSAGNLLAGRVVDRIGPRPVLVSGWLAYGLIYLAFALAASQWQIWLYFLLYGASVALAEPAEKTLVTHWAGVEQSGLAFGWFNFAIGVAALPSSLIFGWLYQRFGAMPAFGWGAGLAMLATVLLLAIRSDARTPPTESFA